MVSTHTLFNFSFSLPFFKVDEMEATNKDEATSDDGCNKRPSKFNMCVMNQIVKVNLSG